MRIIRQLLFKLIFFSVLFTANSFSQSTASREVDSTLVYFELATDSAFFFLDFKYAKTVFDGDSLYVSSWIHFIELSSPFLKPLKQKIDFRGKKRFKLSYNEEKRETSKETIAGNTSLKHLTGKNFLFRSDDKTNIFLNDSLLGVGAVAFNSNKKRVRLKFKLDGKTRYRSFVNDPATVTVKRFYMRPVKETAVAYSFIPGLAQLYKRDRMKGMAFASVFGILTLSTSYEIAQHRKQVNDFNRIKAKYLETRVQTEALELGNELEKLSSRIDKTITRQRLYLSGAVLIYTTNVLDGILKKPKLGYRKERTLDIELSTMQNLNSIKIKYNM